MKEYIEREALIQQMADNFRQGVWEGCDCGEYRIAEDTILEAPAADVVSRAAFDQVMWERDVAIQQLREDYGVGLGEKKAADVVERKRGEWKGEGMGDFSCSLCGVYQSFYTGRTNFCPNCGADMKGDT